MNNYLDTNQQLWNAWTPLHEISDFYDLPGFRAGKSSLRPIERTELTDVAGRSLLHLQCHFGLDTLSWARKGALVTGVDFSDRSIALARSLSTELGIPATFVWSDVEHLPARLSGQFEIRLQLLDAVGAVMGRSNPQVEKLVMGVTEQYVVECQHIRTNWTDGPNLDQQLCVLWSFAEGKIVSGQHLAADEDRLDSFYTALLKG